METSLTTINGYEVFVDKEDLYAFGDMKWEVDSCGYVRNRVQTNGVRVEIRLHREVMRAKQGEIVDHIDGDKLNNKKSNLRIATAKGNSRNKKIPSTNNSGYKGVCKVNAYERYKAYVQMGDRQSHLGYFANKEDAARMYNFWAADLFGEYARLNEINGTKYEVVAQG